VVAWLRTSRLRLRFAKYSIGSMVALATSELAFAICYGTGWLGTSAASAVAFVAGAVPNWILNRQWAWERKGRIDVRREVLLYALVSFVSWAASAFATGAANHFTRHMAAGHLTRVVIVSGAYAATYGVLFVLKFAVFEKTVFVGATDAPAPSTTS
jgi:putative flippase GtrA